MYFFLADKVAERTALRVGSENILTIRKMSQEKTIKLYLAQKISNLKKSAKVHATENTVQ